MRTSSNYGLKLMEGTDNVRRQDFVDNFTTIDTKMKEIERKATYYGATSGTNTYTTSITGITSYYDGLKVTVKIGTTSTGASTLNINSLGSKTILDSNGNAITSGGLKAGIPYTLVYNGTNFIVLGKGGGGNATADKILSGYTATVDSGQITGTMPNRGEYQYAGGIGSADDYFALNKIPYGYYPSSSNGWSPEIRYKMSDVASFLGIASNKILAGNTIAGVAGGIPNRGAPTVNLNAGGSYSLSAGYYSGGKINATGKQSIEGDYTTTTTRKFARLNGGYLDEKYVVIVNNISFTPKFICCWENDNIVTSTIYDKTTDRFITIKFGSLNTKGVQEHYRLADNSFAFNNGTLLIPVETNSTYHYIITN